MRIRWDPVQVMDAADQLEGNIARIVTPLKKARANAEKARNIPNLPDYVKQRLTRFMFDVERIVGGVEHTSSRYNLETRELEPYTYISTGSLATAIEAIRKEVPQDALKEAKSHPKLLKIGV